MRTREASESCWYPTIDEESIAIDFVVVAWYLELGWMQRLADVMHPCPVEDCRDIEPKRRKCVAEGLNELNRYVANDPKMRR